VQTFEEIAMLSKAMSDTNRVKIVTLIQRDTKVCVCEICDTLALSQPLVSRHLKQLKESGILHSSKEGKWIMYEIVTSPTSLMKAYLIECKKIEKSLTNLVSCMVR